MSSLRAWNTTCKAQKIVTNKTTPSEAPTPVWSSAALKSTTGLSGRARPQSCVLERRAATVISTLPTSACRSDRAPMRRALSWMLWRVAACLKFSWSQAAKIKKICCKSLFSFSYFAYLVCRQAHKNLAQVLHEGSHTSCNGTRKMWKCKHQSYLFSNRHWRKQMSLSLSVTCERVELSTVLIEPNGARKKSSPQGAPWRRTGVAKQSRAGKHWMQPSSETRHQPSAKTMSIKKTSMHRRNKNNQKYQATPMSDEERPQCTRPRQVRANIECSQEPSPALGPSTNDPR